jgi:hypothetical protein
VRREQAAPDSSRYEPATVTQTTHVEAAWVVLDIFAGVVGVAIDWATGRSRALDSRQHFVVLEGENG